MTLFYDLTDEERDQAAELLNTSTTLEEMDSDEKSLLVHLEDRAVNNKGVLDASKVNRSDMEIIRSWVGYGFIKWEGLDDPHVRAVLKNKFETEVWHDRRTGGDTHVFQLAEEFIDMAHQERKNRIRRTETDLDELQETVEESRPTTA